LEVGITYNSMLCNDFTGPARFRLNMPEVALELKRVWHPCARRSIMGSEDEDDCLVYKTFF